jgi:hypothetical protein
MRERMRTQYAMFNRTVIRMTTSEPVGSFGYWQHLREWCAGPLSSMFPTNLGTWKTKGPELVSTIEINLDLPASTGLADARIGIVDFIRMTYHLRPQSILRFQLQSQAKLSGVHTTTLESMCKAFFVFISSIVDKDPETMSLTCPEVWMKDMAT